MTTTHFIWDELSDNVLMETDEFGAATAEYTQEPDQFGELISQHRDGATSQYHFDGLGSTRQLTDDNQNVTDEYTFSAFGEEVASSGATVNPFGYQGSVGYHANPTTEDLYVRARHYRPSIGRWLSEDPRGFVDGVNQFAYVKNNPANETDPSGLSCCCCCVQDLKVTNDRRYLTPTWMGHQFDFTATIKNVNSWFNDDRECTFDWWEKWEHPPTNLVRLGVENMKWYDTAAIDRPPHSSQVAWEARDRTCGSNVSVSGTDYPVTKLTMSRGRRPSGYRQLWIKMVVKSAPNCCHTVSKWICLHQRLEVLNGVPNWDPSASFLKIVPLGDCANWPPSTAPRPWEWPHRTGGT